MSVWDIVNDISCDKKGTTFDEKEYVPFLVNRALSMHPDTVLFADEMNFYRDISAAMQYDYYLNAIRPRKRFGGKWPKRKEDEDTKLVAEHYGFGHEKAKAAAAVLTPDQLEELRKSKGGTE